MAAMFATFYYHVLLTLIEINRDEWKTIDPIIVLREPLVSKYVAITLIKISNHY